MDSFRKELLCGVEERAGEDDDGGGTVSGFDVLGGREVDELRTSWSVERGIEGERTGGVTIFAAGCMGAISLRIVAPSLVMRTCPEAVTIILSEDFGPSAVRTADATATHDAIRVSRGRMERRREITLRGGDIAQSHLLRLLIVLRSVRVSRSTRRSMRGLAWKLVRRAACGAAILV